MDSIPHTTVESETEFFVRPKEQEETSVVGPVGLPRSAILGGVESGGLGNTTRRPDQRG